MRAPKHWDRRVALILRRPEAVSKDEGVLTGIA